MLKIVVAVALLCIFVSEGVLGLDERSAKEKRCAKTLPKPFGNIDMKWATSVKNWYITHGSRLEIYRVASSVNKTPIDEIHEDDLYYRGCFMVNWESKDPVIRGFRGKTAEAKVKPEVSGVLTVKYENYEFGGTAVMTLTDNKTFQFFYKCYDDGEATWGVLSTVDDLDKKTENLIHEHARSLGFHEDNFVELEFEQCEGSKAQRNEL